MSQLESLREMLYKEMAKGTREEVLRISQELDKLILQYIQQNTNLNKMTA